MSARPNFKLVPFDLEGMLVDPQNRAMTAAMLETFAQQRVMLTTAQVGSVAGLVNYEQVRTLLEMPAVGEQFQIVHGRRWNEADAMELAQELVTQQRSAIGRYCEIADGAVDCTADLKSRGLAIGIVSNYPREVAELLWDALGIEGIAIDASACVDDVPTGRPAPWMIFRLMQELDVFPPAAVVKVGSSPLSSEEAANAGCRSMIVGGDQLKTLAEVPRAMESLIAKSG